MQTAETIVIPIAKISITDRHRRDMGDLEELAASIESQGLLQPIGITQEKRLVFGERRLRAVRDVLHQKTIEARIVSMRSILRGEWDENQIRKDFTASERVSLAEEIKAELGSRQGKRTDLHEEELVENFPQVDGRKTREVVAEKAGFGNETTYRQAREVVQKGHADLIAAMDTGEVAISVAAKICELPKSEQKKVVAGGKQAIKEAVKSAQKSDAKSGSSDELSPAEVLDRINAAVRPILERCSEESRDLLANKLIQMGNEILKYGGLRE